MLLPMAMILVALVATEILLHRRSLHRAPKPVVLDPYLDRLARLSRH